MAPSNLSNIRMNIRVEFLIEHALSLLPPHILQCLVKVIAALRTNFFNAFVISVPEVYLLSDFCHVVQYQLSLSTLGPLHFVGRTAGNPDAMPREFHGCYAIYYVFEA